MPRALVALFLIASVVFGTTLALVWQTLPPRHVALSPPLPATTVLGGYHIHSNRSDGSGTVDSIAAAAHDAGLSFIVMTDHGDGMAPSLPPSYRSGVLCIDAVEVSTNGGHVVALGLDGPAPYPMAGEPSDVIEDIHRRGGAAFVAHPDSAKAELQWRDWNTPYDGVEWLNADSEWRAEKSSWRLTEIGARLLLRAPETIASLFHRPTPTLRRWDGVTRRRPVVTVAGLDAHANIAGWPHYADMFRALTQAVELDAPLSGNAAEDAKVVVAALRAGRTYSVVSAFASPAQLDFSASSDRGNATIGGALGAGSAIHWQASVPQAPSARVALIQDGREVASGRGSVTYESAGQPGAVHVEVTYPGFTMPWIVSNPIYVGIQGTADTLDEFRADQSPSTDPVDVLAAGGWHVEHDPQSTGDVTTNGGWSFQYALGGGAPAGQFAAAVVPADPSTGVDRVQLTIRADRPMRVSVQVRLVRPNGQRWRRSIYVDTTDRTVVLPLSSFVVADHQTTQKPIVTVLRDMMLVVDTVNTVPGSRGTIWLTAAALGRVKPDAATSGR